ncbi:hypothetical protein BKA62DRAFT_718285 [Auriculariales sp. MPI-PUGE-AT-0066]|nr:hypothetical protein BKA62DRAFT_718285 [Auriculariales sp. MPI-PUGE-AT-0066]
MSDVKVPVSVLNSALGTAALGAYINVFVFAIECVALRNYFQRFSNDHWPIRLLLTVMVLTDIIATGNNCAMVYDYTISNWGNPVRLGETIVQVSIYVMLMAFSVIFMHSFLIFRYWNLSRNVVIAGILVVVATGAFVGDVLVIWSVHEFQLVEERGKHRLFATIWLSCAAAADVLIASALIFELRRVRTTYQKTRNLLRRLITTAGMSGVGTASLALLTMITFVVWPTANYCMIFGMSVGRAATLTVLYNLSLRKSTTDASETNIHGVSSNGISADQTGFRFTHNSNTDATRTHGISVQQSKIVHVDDGKRINTMTFDDSAQGIDDSSDHKYPPV